MKKTVAFCFLIFALCLCTFGAVAVNAAEIGTGEKSCPDFEYADTAYATLHEFGFPLEEIRAFFPLTPEIRYEDGKYMVKDFGADSAEGYHDNG